MKTCAFCGKVFQRIYNPKTRYCSHDCARAALKVPDDVRFWAKVRKPNQESCWEWQGKMRPDGYGTLSIGAEHTRAHRISWELHHGPIPNGLCVLHRCDNRRCVNPVHLFLGTKADNNRDMMQKGRGNQPYGEKKRNSKLTADAVLMIRASAESNTSLGRKFGVDNSVISRVRNRLSWTRVGEAQ